jgi:hypothetical protein
MTAGTALAAVHPAAPRNAGCECEIRCEPEGLKSGRHSITNPRRRWRGFVIQKSDAATPPPRRRLERKSLPSTRSRVGAAGGGPE